MKIQVQGCIDCPLCAFQDMGGGYVCEAFKKPGNDAYIPQNEFYMPETPDWCPLLNGSVTIEKVPSDAELREFASAVSLKSVSEIVDSNK